MPGPTSQQLGHGLTPIQPSQSDGLDGIGLKLVQPVDIPSIDCGHATYCWAGHVRLSAVKDSHNIVRLIYAVACTNAAVDGIPADRITGTIAHIIFLSTNILLCS